MVFLAAHLLISALYCDGTVTLANLSPTGQVIHPPFLLICLSPSHATASYCREFNLMNRPVRLADALASVACAVVIKTR